MSVNNQAGVGC